MSLPLHAPPCSNRQSLQSRRILLLFFPFPSFIFNLSLSLSLLLLLPLRLCRVPALYCSSPSSPHLHLSPCVPERGGGKAAGNCWW